MFLIDCFRLYICRVAANAGLEVTRRQRSHPLAIYSIVTEVRSASFGIAEGNQSSRRKTPHGRYVENMQNPTLSCTASRCRSSTTSSNKILSYYILLKYVDLLCLLLHAAAHLWRHLTRGSRPLKPLAPMSLERNKLPNLSDIRPDGHQ